MDVVMDADSRETCRATGLTVADTFLSASTAGHIHAPTPLSPAPPVVQSQKPSCQNTKDLRELTISPKLK
jgi:hypothetical protein